MEGETTLLPVLVQRVSAEHETEIIFQDLGAILLPDWLDQAKLYDLTGFRPTNEGLR